MPVAYLKGVETLTVQIKSSISASEFKALTRPLIGLPVSRPWRGHGSALILELGKDKHGNIETKTEEDLNAKQRALDAQTIIETRMNDWFKLNPDATLREVKEELNKALPDGTRAGAVDAMNKLQKKQAPKVQAAGKITSYGYPNDETPNSNSAAGIGAFGTGYKLEYGDIAVSPDIEAQFKAKGIKPLSYIGLKMADGTVRQARWADRTAQDSDIAAGRVKGVTRPLRGRFDFYSPKGRDEDEGLAVVDWFPIKS